MLARKGISFVSRHNSHLLRKLSFCFEAYQKNPSKEDEAISDSLPVSDFSSSIHNLSPLLSDSRFPSNGYKIELVDHDAWRVSSGLSQAWQRKDWDTPETSSSSGQEESNEVIDFNSSNVVDEVDFEDIDNMRIRGNLFYKLEKSSKEFEEYNLEFHRRKKSPKRGDDKKENYKKEKKASQIPKTSRVQEVQNTKTVNIPQLREANVTSVENKKQRTLTFNQLTGPYHEPFCLDIFISKASVRACVVHRVTSRVVAVAHSISKDMKFDFTSTKNKNTCAAVGALLAQRALADDIHDVIYTPRKGDRLEGKLQIVLQSVINNGINVKVKIKQRKPKKAFQSPQRY